MRFEGQNRDFFLVVIWTRTLCARSWSSSSVPNVARSRCSVKTDCTLILARTHKHTHRRNTKIDAHRPLTLTPAHRPTTKIEAHGPNTSFDTLTRTPHALTHSFTFFSCSCAGASISATASAPCIHHLRALRPPGQRVKA